MFDRVTQINKYAIPYFLINGFSFMRLGQYFFIQDFSFSYHQKS